MIDYDPTWADLLHAAATFITELDSGRYEQDEKACDALFEVMWNKASEGTDYLTLEHTDGRIIQFSARR